MRAWKRQIMNSNQVKKCLRKKTLKFFNAKSSTKSEFDVKNGYGS